jgi:hypothetical protein
MNSIAVHETVPGYTVTVQRGFTKDGRDQMQISIMEEPGSLPSMPENICCDVPTWMAFVKVVDDLRRFASEQELKFSGGK